MGLSDLPANDAAARTTSGRHLLLLLATFTAAIFVSAALLFMVQPMFTRWCCAPGRRAVGVVGGDRLLPGRVARGLCLRPLAHALCAGARVDRHPSRGDGRRRVRAAAVDRHRLGAPAGVPEKRYGLMGLFAASIGLPFFALAANKPVCCRRGFRRAPIIRPRKTPTSSTPPAISEASSRSWSYPSVIEPFVGAAGPGQRLVARFRPADRAVDRLRCSAVAVPRLRRQRPPQQTRPTRRRPGATPRPGWRSRRCRRACWWR